MAQPEGGYKYPESSPPSNDVHHYHHEAPTPDKFTLTRRVDTKSGQVSYGWDIELHGTDPAALVDDLEAFNDRLEQMYPAPKISPEA